MARPPKPIDWELVKQMVIAGMSAKSIALRFDIDESNFYRRFKDEFGDDYTTFASKSKGSKVENILFMQYAQAMKGNVKMLELLGYEYCGQGKKKDEKETDSELMKKSFDDKMTHIVGLLSNRNIEDSNINNEAKS